MALKLQGIETPPPGPRLPAVPVEKLPSDDSELIKIWRPQAAMRALKGESEFSIARFLHSKGVEGIAARAAAKEIVANPENAGAFGASLSKVIGILLLVLGLIAPVLVFAFNLGGFIGIAALFGCFIGVVGGCRLLWDPPSCPPAV